jgi:hypothetical protein
MKTRTNGVRTRSKLIARANDWRRQVIGAFVQGEGSVEDLQTEAVRPQSLGFSGHDLAHWAGDLERRRDGALRKFRAINARIAQGRGNPERLKAEQGSLSHLVRGLNAALKAVRVEQYQRETVKTVPEPKDTPETKTMLEPSPVEPLRVRKSLSSRRRKALRKAHEARAEIKLQGFEELAEYEVNNRLAERIAA